MTPPIPAPGSRWFQNEPLPDGQRIAHTVLTYRYPDVLTWSDPAPASSGFGGFSFKGSLKEFLSRFTRIP